MSDASAAGEIDPRPRCAWCREPIPAGKRSDSRFCRKRCRQNAWAFERFAVARERAERPMRFAYADPPYPGFAHYYVGHPDYGGEVDHRELVSRLQAYDGWALSTSAEALPFVLSLLQDVDVSVAAWFRGGRPGAVKRPRSSWEPVVYAGGRHVVADTGRVDDALVHRARARTTDPGRVIGAKPAAFAFWMFELLGARPGDTLDDLYPGSGGIGRAWAAFERSARAQDDASNGAGDDASTLPRGDASLDVEHDVSTAAAVDASARTWDDPSTRTAERTADGSIPVTVGGGRDFPSPGPE